MKFYSFILWAGIGAICIAGLSACIGMRSQVPANSTQAQVRHDKAFSFVVIGDTPYDDYGKARERGMSKDQKMLVAAVKKIKTEIKPPLLFMLGIQKKAILNALNIPMIDLRC